IYSSALSPQAGWQNLVMDVDNAHPQALSARDLVIELRSDTYRSPSLPGVDLGVAVSHVTIEPLPGAPSPGLVVPNVRIMLMVLGLAVSIYLLVFRSGGPRFSRPR